MCVICTQWNKNRDLEEFKEMVRNGYREVLLDPNASQEEKEHMHQVMLDCAMETQKASDENLFNMWFMSNIKTTKKGKGFE